VAQVVHADDVASALDLAAHSLDGVFNVACDGWLSADDAAALMRHPLTPALSAETLTSVLRTGWRLGLSDVPPEIVPYLVYSWAISNARLRAAGWEPKYTNAQALAEAQASFEPADTRVAQFAAAGSAAVAGGATLAWFARRHHNKRRHP
jgi:nucleoside-diphosphate-sugar epimerase